MKTLIVAGTIALLSTAAFANDKTLGESSEYYGSPLLDHGQPSTSNTLSKNHDHGDNAVNNFVDHEHARMMADHNRVIAEHNQMMGAMHDHGDNTVNNFVPHKEN